MQPARNVFWMLLFHYRGRTPDWYHAAMPPILSNSIQGIKKSFLSNDQETNVWAWKYECETLSWLVTETCCRCRPTVDVSEVLWRICGIWIHARSSCCNPILHKAASGNWKWRTIDWEGTKGPYSKWKLWSMELALFSYVCIAFDTNVITGMQIFADYFTEMYT